MAASGASAASKPVDMSIDEQLLKAEELKLQGNQAFEWGDLTEALKQWHHVSVNNGVFCVVLQSSS